jgi:TolA-binding protein
MFRQLSILVLAAAPVLLAADKPNPDILALQRDVAIMQEMLKTFQASVTERLGALQTQVQTSIDAARQANTAAAGVQQTLERSLREQESRLLPPVTGLGARVDGVAGEVRAVQQGVSDLASVMQKLQTQMADVNRALIALQAAAAPPSPAPPASANQLFTSAEGDRLQGKLDLALQEYAEYLKWYPDDAQAFAAQYQVAQIHYSNKEYETAVQEFDVLMRKYPDNTKMAEALYYKGASLKELGRANQAADTFGELRKRFPEHTLAKQAANPRR